MSRDSQLTKGAYVPSPSILALSSFLTIFLASELTRDSELRFLELDSGGRQIFPAWGSRALCASPGAAYVDLSEATATILPVKNSSVAGFLKTRQGPDVTAF